MEIKFNALRRALDRSGVVTLALTCVLAVASYFFGQPLAIELHWFWMALGSLCMVSLSALQFIRTQRLRHHDDELHAILDAVPHILFFKDTQSRYQTINAEFARTFGLDASSAVGKKDVDIFGPELHERFLAQDRELFASGTARTYDEEIAANGGIRKLQSRKQPVYDRRGKLRGIVGVAIDVTEQKIVQRQLEDLNARLGVALEAARMGVWEWKPANGEIRIDPRARDILGLKDSDGDVSDFFARVHPDDREALQARIELARSRDEVAAYEFRVVDDSGAERWVEGYMSMDRVRAGYDCVIGVNRDITERRQAELELSEAKSQAEKVLAELEQSRSDLELALSVGGLGVWRSTTRLGRLEHLSDPAFLDAPITADRRSREICGLDEEASVTYRQLLMLIHPQDRARVASRLQEVYRHRHGAYRKQFRIVRPDGVERTLEVRGSLSVRREPGGREDEPATVVSFIGIAKDISEEEALKARLVTKAEEARSAVDAKAHFLAMMSHEVRTPLSGVLGMIDLVIDTPLNEDQRSMLLRCRESSVSLLTIINDILDFSKIEAGMLDIESRPLSLASLVEDVCATFTAETARKAIGLSFHVDATVPQFVVGDAVRLRQVLTNLIGNAIKFTHQGGVRVEARRTEKGQLALAVQDTGIGIDPRATRTLFEPFRQADIATTRRYGGTGLGLTIVKQLVELMNGSVRCESELGVGSRFIVSLPLQPWVPSVGAAGGRGTPHRLAIDASAKALAEAAPGGGGQRVLLAEDHPINREVITRQLVKLGYACECAEDGLQAWEMLQAADAAAGYALLLTDCHMPRMDGYELTRRLREREAAQGLPRLPIVALTADALQGEAERCLALGMDAYLSKPLQLEDLREALSKVLQAAGEKDASAGGDGDAAQPYARLMQLCDGDVAKVAKLVHIFMSATEQDMKAMDRAAEAADPAALRQLAHRMSSACHQLDEDEAVSAFKAVELQAQAPGQLQPQTLEAYRVARTELDSVMRRAQAFARSHA